MLIIVSFCLQLKVAMINISIISAIQHKIYFIWKFLVSQHMGLQLRESLHMHTSIRHFTLHITSGARTRTRTPTHTHTHTPFTTLAADVVSVTHERARDSIEHVQKHWHSPPLGNGCDWIFQLINVFPFTHIVGCVNVKQTQWLSAMSWRTSSMAWVEISAQHYHWNWPQVPLPHHATAYCTPRIPFDLLTFELSVTRWFNAINIIIPEYQWHNQPYLLIAICPFTYVRIH